MPKARTKKVEELKEKLIERIKSDYYQPGDRFFSNRSIATRFDVSYVTAHKLLSELKEEGYLGRKAQSGSYLKGGPTQFTTVGLYFSERAKNKSSYSAFILDKLTQRLDKQNISWEIVWTDERTKLNDKLYPVILDFPSLQKELYHKSMFGLLLNKKPDSGLSSIWVDSVYIDNYSGGMTAAQVMKMHLNVENYVVFSGPESDARSRARVAGFCSVLPQSRVISAGSWHFEEALNQANKVFEQEADAVFCCNDKIAYSILYYCREHGISVPPIMGFDNMAISEKYNFSTIAVPWDETIEHAINLIMVRLSGNTESTKHIQLTTKPLLRGSDFL